MTTIEPLVTQHLDLWTSAIEKKATTGRGSSNKTSLYGIKKLRELILDLAVRGLLVPQDPNDEPASKLLERIAAEKAQLVKDGKIKKQKPLPEISEDEKPFELPKGWEWCRLGHISHQITDGTHHTPTYLESGIPFISVKDIDGKTVNFSNCKYISEDEHSQINLRCNPSLKDLLLCRIGTLGRPTLVDTSKPFSIFVSVGLIKYPQDKIYPSYFHRLFQSPLMESQYQEIKAGGSHTNKLNLNAIPSLKLAIPPLNEQPRIVTKVNELMTLCDHLEQETESHISAHQTLVETLLGTLSNAADKGEFDTTWQRIFDHFDTLFTTEHSIDQLKQTILQLAVMGKLVPQDPNDEPASKLLERIAAEKAQLVKDGKIKKQKPLPEISEDEKPFELPEGWEWCYVWDIATLITSGSRDWAKYYSDQGAIFLTMSNLTRGGYDLRMKNTRFVRPPKKSEGKRTRLEANDLVISITGDVGNLGLIPQGFGEAYINQHSAVLRFSPACQDKFFPELMRSPLAKKQFEAPQRGIKNSFRLGDVGEMIIPLPPTSERLRIVTKVNELMSLCDQLKGNIQKSQVTTLKLTNAITDNALEQARPNHSESHQYSKSRSKVAENA